MATNPKTYPPAIRAALDAQAKRQEVVARRAGFYVATRDGATTGQHQRRVDAQKKETT